MSNDDRIVPRDYPQPVSVRRPPPSIVDPALLPPQTAPPVQAAPQVIYINNVLPPAPAGSVPAPPAPPEVHHHHYTTQNTHKISYRIPTPPSHSALGTASLALGIIACVVCWVPWLGLIAVPVGAIGAVIGLLGVLISVLFRRSSVGLPIAGIFICCLAAGISIASTRTLPYWRGQLEKTISTVLPKGTISLPTAAPSSSAPPPPPLPAPISKALSNPGSLFDSSSATPTPAAPPIAKPVVTPSNAPKPAIASKLDPAIAAARDQLTAAEKACDQRTMQTPQYQAAAKAATDARAHETSLRENSPGTADLFQASQDMIQADNAVSDTLTRAQAADPEVIAARQALVAARSAAAH